MIQVLVPCKADVKIEDFVMSRFHMTIFCRKNGLQTAFTYVLSHDIEQARQLGNFVELKFEDAVFSLKPGPLLLRSILTFALGPQGDFDSEVLRLEYSSLITPDSIVDQHLGTFDRSIKKMEQILGGYDEKDYRSERTWAVARDGTRILISLVYKINAVRHDGSDPLLLEVYGAHEKSLNPSFSNARLSLLEYGVVYAIAHIRGGGEMGRFIVPCFKIRSLFQGLV